MGKFKFKPAYAALILILIYLGSLVMINPFGPSLSLPKENIINYKLTEEQEDYAIKLGKTVIAFEYDEACEPCVEQKVFLEKIAREQKNQIILQEISMDLTNSTRLRFVSYYGEKFLRNPSENEIWDTLCLLMINPPTYCALREV
ncbi:MAG: hypothetical protein QMD14_02510 [Candidatus Aenigmarchaeota archaeon]|nr:hypothetical protein [Candidatus Aenigmarchaeota archaeon]